jgi:hypothetical protein
MMACLVVGVAVLHVQDAKADPVGLQQEIERSQEIPDQQQPQEPGPKTGTQDGGAVQREMVTLHPVDTGKSVITFSIGKSTSQTPLNRFAVKTNLLYGGGTLTPNLGLDIGLGKKTSIGLIAGYNKWGNLWDNSATGPEWDPNNFYRRRLDHIYGKAEFRYWFRNRFDSHFVGTSLFYADYSVGELDLPLIFDKENDYVGNAYGLGLTYGYFWRWSPHWGMEFTIGAGVAVIEYDKKTINIGESDFTLADGDRYRKTFAGPTSIGINLVFMIK